MTETQKRIEAYQKALPGIKEKVAAVATLLALSIIMLTSASFAWVTLSRSPEVTPVATNVAANGNLEIALATGDGKTPPEESKVGDSVANAEQTIVDANATWGNLVNLNDEAYGLESLILRPAQLNVTSLKDSPLSAAEFMDDGRVSQLLSNFAYTNWVAATAERDGYFSVLSEQKLGVRAISSTATDAEGAALQYANMKSAILAKNNTAGSIYTSMTNNKTYMQSLATLMGKYMTDRMDSDGTYKDPDVNVSDLRNLISMYEEFLEAFDAEAEALAGLANIQLYLKYGYGVDDTPNYTPLKAEDIYGARSTAELKKATDGVVVISDLETFIKDRNTIATDITSLKGKVEGLSDTATLKWSNSVAGIVNNLVNVGDCMMHDGAYIKNIGATKAMDYLGNDDNVAIITNGILYNFELRTGAYIDVKDMSIEVSIKRSIINTTQAVEADIKTSAADTGYTLFMKDLKAAEAANPGGAKTGNLIAKDTYGLAVDLWVRTNASKSYLVLEGNVLTNKEIVDAKGKDPNGNEVQLYTVSRSGTDSDGNLVSDTYDVYKGKTTVYDDQGNASEVDAWFRADTHTLVPEEDISEEPKKKIDTIVTVIGYEGENRIWDSDSNKGLSVDATTQGSGSCYVYYPATPEDQERSLKLLESFKVAFINGEGKLLATAEMDTENYFAESGRVTVPLVLAPGSGINVGKDVETNKDIYAITALDKDVSTRITVLVYLDGKKLTNKDVLSASEIQGKLNIQFGSSEILLPINDETLKTEELKVSAEVTETEFDYETMNGPMTTDVIVSVQGYEPKEVTAYFIREVSSTQGTREDKMTFTKDIADGKWKTSYTFNVPGNYILRSVWLDGVEYDLELQQRVSVTGFTVSRISASGADENNIVRIMSAENSHTIDLTLQFGTNDPNKMPRKVVGVYTSKETGSATNVNFVLGDGGIWSGSATFYTSGEYVMDYLILDGEYTGLDKSLWQRAELTIGMKVEVFSDGPFNFKYTPSDADFPKTLEVEVMIYDNAGNPMRGLSNVELIYSEKSSRDRFMDTDLTWNGSYYVGEFVTYVGEGEDFGNKRSGGIGIWNFSKVTVGNNELTVATKSPEFIIASTEPPTYESHNTEPNQLYLSTGNNAKMNVWLKNAQTASVAAKIVKTGTADSGRWVEIDSENGRVEVGENTHKFIFSVPQDENGYQDGSWQITEIKVWNAYDADGNAYTKEEPLVFDVSDTNNVTKVVNRINYSFKPNASSNFGKEGNTVTGEFMHDYYLSDLYVDITDFEGEAISGISDVKLTFTYVTGSSSSYGGYSSDFTNQDAEAVITVNLNSSDGRHFAQAENDVKIIRHAGNYKTTFSYTINGTVKTFTEDSQNLPAGAPKFTVSSKAPTVVISDITMDGSGAYAVDLNTTGAINDSVKSSGGFLGIGATNTYTINSQHIFAANNTQYISRIEDNGLTAYLYFKCSHPKTTSTWTDKNFVNHTGHKYNYSNGTGVPAVTITISGMGSFAEKAELIFTKNGGGDVIMVTQYTADSSGGTYWGNYSVHGTDRFVWEKGGATTCKRFIGVMDNERDSEDSDTKTVAGTITADTIKLYFDLDGDGTNEEYRFSLGNAAITINNPY